MEGEEKTKRCDSRQPS